MAFSKKKEIEITAKDFLDKDSEYFQEFKGDGDIDYLIQVKRSENTPNTRREVDNLFTWVTSKEAGYSDCDPDTGKTYNIGDFKNDDGKVLSEDDDFKDKNVVFYLNLYRHSGDVIRADKEREKKGEYDFDSGYMGFAFVDKEKAMKEFGWERIGKKEEDRLFEILKEEVKIMNAVNYGDVYDIGVTHLSNEDTNWCSDYICVEEEDIRDSVNDILIEYVSDKYERKEIVENMFGADERVLESMVCIGNRDLSNVNKICKKSYLHIDLMKGILDEKDKNGNIIYYLERCKRLDNGKLKSEYWEFTKDFSEISAKEFLNQWDKKYNKNIEKKKEEKRGIKI